MSRIGLRGSGPVREKSVQPILRATALSITLSAAFPIHAADEQAVIVTATRPSARASAVVSDVSVVTREQIEQAPQSSLGELLQAQPGLQISTNGGIGTPTSIHVPMSWSAARGAT